MQARKLGNVSQPGTPESAVRSSQDLISARDGASRETGDRDSGNKDAASRFLQYLRDWEDKFAKNDGAATGGSSDAGVPGFDPHCPELQTAWWSGPESSSGALQTSVPQQGRPIICCLNTYPNGITFSVHQHPNQSVPGRDGQPRVASESEAELRAPEVASPGRSGKPSKKRVGAAKPALQDLTPIFQEDETRGDGGPDERRYLPDQFHLRFRDNRDLRTPAGRYHLHRENVARALSQHLAQLHRLGKLNDSILYFGTMTDPFLSLHKKFDVTMSCLDVIERYAPGRVIFQTRSPMVISVLPALKKLGNRAAVAIAVETNSEKAVARYTPGMPRIAERLVAADGLRKQGVVVNLQVSPVLPYGDFVRDAWDFAELLDRHADYVTFGSLSTGNPAEERYLRSMPIAQKLSADGMYAWLRPHAYQAVFHAMSVLAKEKLLLPVMSSSAPKQLKLFAA